MSRLGTRTVSLGFSSHSQVLSPSVVNPGHCSGHSMFVWQVTSSTDVTSFESFSHPGNPARPFWQRRDRNDLPAPHDPWQLDQFDHSPQNGAFKLLFLRLKTIKLTFLTKILISPFNVVGYCQATTHWSFECNIHRKRDLLVSTKTYKKIL